jgi:hypothetical protein
MIQYVLKSGILLLYVECVMRFRSFKILKDIVRREEVRTRPSQEIVDSALLCHSMDVACVFYFKRVMCLQRSAATTLLLRHHGWEAETVIGAQILPFKSHAWVEIKGAVVNDKPYMLDIYRVLERC